MKTLLAILLFSLTALGADFSSQGGNGTATFTTNGMPFTLNAPSWVTAFASLDGTSITYTVAANTDYHKRVGPITFTQNGATQTHEIVEAGKATVVSGASYSTDRISQGGFISIFGVDLTVDNNVTVFIGGAQATVLYASGTQINAILPANLATGPSVVTIESALNKTTDLINVKAIAPDLFSINQQGTGEAAGTLQLNRGETETFYYPLDVMGVGFRLSTDNHFLLLYGSGMRNQDKNLADYALIGGEQYPIIYAGAQGQYEGLDQVAIPLPVSLSGRGQLSLQIFIDGVSSNALTVKFPPQI